MVLGLVSPVFAQNTVLAQNEEGRVADQKGKIRSIRIEVRDVFDEPDAGGFYRGVNAVKISTKEHVVKRELLFHEGDTFDSFRLAESERNLRMIPFIRKVSITPIWDGENVDIVVSVQDTWTLFPFISFNSGGGGKGKTTVGLAETNVLGYGKRVEGLYSDDEGRQTVAAVYDDRRFLDSKEQLTVGVFDRSDGYQTVGFYGRPFRSLTQPDGYSLDTNFYDLVGKLYENGTERYIYREYHQAASAGYTIAKGNPEFESSVRRYTFGYDYSASRFRQANSSDYQEANVNPKTVSNDPDMLANDRVYSGPFFAFQRVEPDFVAMNYLDRFERVEDYNLGNDFYARVTFASDALGSDEDTLIYNVSDGQGWRISPTSFVRGRLGLVSRNNTEAFRNTVFSGVMRYYNVLGAKYLDGVYIGKHTFVASASFDLADELDRDKELLLGADTGLRGYKNRTFSGDNRALLTLEHRVHLADDIFHLVSLGSAAFFDIGGASRGSFGDVLSDRLYEDVGVGLRIGFPRSSGGSVLRIDVAFPMRDGPDGSTQWEPRILFTTGQSVTASIPSESQQTGGSNVTVKFLP